MITIKNFADLCQCEASTLRYYDRIDLLKPVKVDNETGYRYYEESQAVDFIKIKNLQQAEFSIEEIKDLLSKSDTEIAEAFDKKIQMQRKRLARTLEIQKIYLKEKETMENLIEMLSTYVLSQLNDPNALTEFALDKKDHDQLVNRLRDYLIKWTHDATQSDDEMVLKMDDEVIKGKEKIAERIQMLDTEEVADTVILSHEEEMEESLFDLSEYTVVYQVHDWEHVYEFIDLIPALKRGKEYIFDVQTIDENKLSSGAFAMYMLGALVVKKNGINIRMGCNVNRSEDGKNHFVMYQK